MSEIKEVNTDLKILYVVNPKDKWVMLTNYSDVVVKLRLGHMFKGWFYLMPYTEYLSEAQHGNIYACTDSDTAKVGVYVAKK